MNSLEVIFQKGCTHETVGVCALEAALLDSGDRVFASLAVTYRATLIFLLEDRQCINSL